MAVQNQGKLIVFSAPSGSGKTTIVRHLLADKSLNLDFSISATSREKRGDEIDGIDYHFISLNSFKNHIKDKDFIEWEEVYHNNYYGTLRSEVQRIWSEGKHAIFDIDVKGGLRIKKKFPKQTLAVFVQSPSIKEMEKRLRNRKTDSEEKIKERIAKAAAELKYAPDFDRILLNDNIDKAKQDAYNLVKDFIEN